MFEKILVPLDMSKMAEEAMPHVVDMAKAFGSEVCLVNICEPEGQDNAPCLAYLNEQAAALKSALAAERVTTELITGSPDKAITRYARERKVSVIFLTSHGRSGSALWSLGSTAEKILRRTSVPLIIIKVKEGQPARTGLFRRILVCLDGSDLGARVMPYIIGIARQMGSEVTLLHVIDTDKRVHSLGRIDTVPFREEELETLKKRYTAYLERQKQAFTGVTSSVSTVVKTGRVAEEILKYAAENKFSLIALSSHGHSGFEAWIIGSVTTKIVHAGNTSVFFAPVTES